MKAHVRRLLLITTILFFCVGCDQLTKTAARNFLTPRPISYWSDMFRLQYIENTGAFLSLGSSMPAPARFWLLCVLTGFWLAALLVIVFANRCRQWWFITGLSLVIGGGLGNLIDRIMNHGAVIDFMNIGIGRLRTGIFNVADGAIMIGMGIILVEGSRRPSPLG